MLTMQGFAFMIDKQPNPAQEQAEGLSLLEQRLSTTGHQKTFI